MAQQLVPVAIFLCAWLFIESFKRSERATAVLLLVTASAVCAAGSLIGADHRAASFGPSLSGWGLHWFLTVAIFVVVSRAARSLPESWLRGTILLGVFWIVIPVAAVEAWLGAEDLGFRREVRMTGSAHLVRARGAPFGAYVLVHTNGHYSAR